MNQRNVVFAPSRGCQPDPQSKWVLFLDRRVSARVFALVPRFCALTERTDQSRYSVPKPNPPPLPLIACLLLQLAHLLSKLTAHTHVMLATVELTGYVSNDVLEKSIIAAPLTDILRNKHFVLK